MEIKIDRISGQIEFAFEKALVGNFVEPLLLLCNHKIKRSFPVDTYLDNIIGKRHTLTQPTEIMKYSKVVLMFLLPLARSKVRK